jgi:hypothetical protein
MPIEHEVDHRHRVVRARGHGTLTDAEVFDYQGSVWSRPEVAGYDELIDMSDVVSIAVPSADRIRELARLSASMDEMHFPSKLAIVAPEDLAFALGRMYETLRGFDKQSTKTVRAFRSVGDALAWLGSGRTAT